MLSLRLILRSFGLILLLVGNVVGQQFSYENRSVLSVIDDIEEKTDYRFLYREALVADIFISFHADENSLFDLFSSAISKNQLGLKIDNDRNQALIYKSNSTQSPTNISISGYVIDDGTGERLPFATISWREFGFIDGVTTNTNGRFDITVSSGEPELIILASYVGYSSEQIRFDLSQTTNWKDVSIRLEAKPYSGKEIIVQGINFYTPNDTVLNGLMKIGTFSPLGESNAVRSLQMLPAVSMNTALNDGINIRGSSSDGFHVLLDGLTVYNQSHLFGLLDAMNADVLKSSGFYYDVTPAQYQAPLGGTLSLITRTGSINDFRSSFGISNTALKSTVEGPLIKGKSSWLLSGRWSYLDEIDWFNNTQIIEYGLDVNRPVDLYVDSRLQGRIIQDISLDEIDIQNTDASFFDLHGKLYFEAKNGSQLVVSGYSGSDKASQDYFRDELDFLSTNTTSNEWNSNSLSGQFYTQLSGNINLSTSIGYTVYNSTYSKDDFDYPTNREPNGNINDSSIIQSLTLENEIYQFDVRQTVSLPLEHGKLEFGISYSDFDVRYTELSLNRDSFLSRRTSQLADIFQQIDLNTSNSIKISIGNRLHYFSNGRYLRWSPRFKFSYQINEDLTFGSGLSRNYQFINRLEYYNINSNDFWILTNEDQAPSSVNQFTSGLYYNINQHVYLQLEGYYKLFDNLRVHELNTNTGSATFKSNKTPWFFDNDGKSSGLEFLMKNRFEDVTLSSSYTLSYSELKNEKINSGNYFYASWDRRHQISTAIEIDLKGGFTLLGSWIYGTGIPSRVQLFDLNAPSTRLPDYSRADFTLNYKVRLSSGDLEAQFSIYNAFDRANTWYDERQPVTITTRNNEIRVPALTHIYDLGVQPSFSLKFNF